MPHSPHADHAVRACYAALRMQDAVRQYSDELRRAQGVEVQIRVGVNSVVRSIGSDLRMDYTAVGQTAHPAARMEQLAELTAVGAARTRLEASARRGVTRFAGTTYLSAGRIDEARSHAQGPGAHPPARGSGKRGPRPLPRRRRRVDKHRRGC